VLERPDEVDCAGESGEGVLAKFVGSVVAVRTLTEFSALLSKFLAEPERLVLERPEEVDCAGEGVLA